jgi:hypothetical protein
MGQKIGIWVSGILAAGIFGTFLGVWAGVDGGPMSGFIGGALAFTCARLWAKEN